MLARHRRPHTGDEDGGGVRTTRVWRRVLGVERTVIESVNLETDGPGQEVLIARVRVKPVRRGAVRAACAAARGYDTSPDPRRWRGLDVGATPVFLQARRSRVSYREHGW
jgi:transposase